MRQMSCCCRASAALARLGSRASGAHSLQLVRLLGPDLGQNAAQLVKIDRFGEVKIESGLSPALDVLSRSKSTERHGCYRSFALRMCHNVVAGPIRQSDVAQNDVEVF